MGYVKLKSGEAKDEEKMFEAFTGDNHTVICRKPKKLERLVNAIEYGKSVHYLSDGYFSLHDLVITLVKKYAPVKVYFSTYAIRELPCRQLMMCRRDKLITSIYCVIDYKAQVRSAEVKAMAELNFDYIALRPIHAKVCVIQNEKISLSITGSSNWTVNPKVEAGVITECKKVAEFHKLWIRKMIANEPVFK